MNGVGGYSGWRWIFIIEGLATVVVAVMSYFLLYDYPDTASFLTRDERAWILRRLSLQFSNNGNVVPEAGDFKWKYVWDAAKDWQVYMAILAMASHFYRTRDSPQYIMGHALELAFGIMGVVAIVITRFAYVRINRQRVDKLVELRPEYSAQELGEMGDKSPTFRYML
ncbi:hypothetical protein AnigIFM63326_000568 [Aspergillus niger]|nr:hypothetical protein AnigIFM63326_000568 [Aspergillus niger]